MPAAHPRLTRVGPSLCADTRFALFDLCTGECSVASMVQLVQKAYELPEPPTTEVEACLDRLRREGVIV